MIGGASGWGGAGMVAVWAIISILSLAAEGGRGVDTGESSIGVPVDPWLACPTRVLLAMEDVLLNFVLMGSAGDRDGDKGGSSTFLEEWRKRLQQERFKAGSEMGDVGLHAEISQQVRVLVAEVEGAV